MKSMTFLKVFLRGKDGVYAGLNGKGAFVSESALHIFDGDKPNSVSPALCWANDHLSERHTRGFLAGPAALSSVLSCTAWGFSCLANCFASGELLPRLFTLACAFVAKEP